MPDKYTCEIIANKKLADNVFTIAVSNKELAAVACPGQFLHIKCGDARLLRRPISICDIRGATVIFVIEAVGEGTRWLSNSRSGQKLDILGPLGNGFSMPEGRIIAIGGGMGVPPMLLTAKSAIGDVTAIIGFRNKERVILKNEFSSICNEVYITTDDGSFGLRGPVTAPLQELLEIGEYSAVLACGPRAMLSAVTVLCRLHGVPCQVSLEERMACGVGACLTCACATVSDGDKRMSRVCRDGPVFNAGEVVW